MNYGLAVEMARLDKTMARPGVAWRFSYCMNNAEMLGAREGKFA